MPDLSRLLRLVEDLPECGNNFRDLEAGNNGTAVVLDTARPYLIAALNEKLRIPVLVITAQPGNAKKFYEQLATWIRSNEIRLFPEPDALPYERLATDAAADIERVRILTSLAGYASGEGDDIPPLVVTSAPAIMEKIPDDSDFRAALHTLQLGMEIEPVRLLERWGAIGYQMENTVEVPGTMSHRGGIIDIFR